MEIRKNLSIEDFKAMELLEKCYYGREHITSFQEAYRWYKTYPYTVVAAFEGDDLAGFINFFPITDQVMEALKAGQFCDRDLRVEHIVDIDKAESLHMFLCCIVVAPFYQDRGLAAYLIKEANDQYKNVEVFCDYVITENVTKEGEALSKRYGLKFHCESAYGSKIYIGRYKEFKESI